MSLTSINTNYGAMTALQTLGAHQALMERTQMRLSTGLAVPSVRENAAHWRIAQGQRGDIRALDVVAQSLQRAGSLLDVSISAGETVSDLLVEMRAKALAAADGSLDAAGRAALAADFAALRDRISQAAAAAEFGGANLVGAGATDQQVLAWHTATVTTTTSGPGNGNGGAGNGGGGNGGNGGNGGGPPQSTTTTTTLNTLTLRAASLTPGGDHVTVGAADGIGTIADAQATLVKLDASIVNVGRALARFGTDAVAVARQLQAVAERRTILETAVSNLVDADLGREAARMAALRTREALIIETLSIANDQPRRLLALFAPGAV